MLLLQPLTLAFSQQLHKQKWSLRAPKHLLLCEYMARAQTRVREQKKSIAPSRALQDDTAIKNMVQYEALYQESITTPERFWAEQAKQLIWLKRWQNVLKYDINHIGHSKKPYVTWFDGGKLNVSVNCLDRHVAAGRGNHPAIIWHGEREDERRTLTYQELLLEVSKIANVL